MKLLFIFLLSGLLFPQYRDREHCLRGVEQIIVKHWGFEVGTRERVVPGELESRAGSALSIKVCKDKPTVKKFVQLLKDLPPSSLKEEEIDVRTQIEVYGICGGCYFYMDKHLVFLEGVMYKMTPALREAIEKLVSTSEKIEEEKR